MEKKRSFQHHYLQSYKWLGYSVKLNACLCLPCCLFGSVADNAQNFVQKAVSNRITLNKKVRLHSTSSTHTSNVRNDGCNTRHSCLFNRNNANRTRRSRSRLDHTTWFSHYTGTSETLSICRKLQRKHWVCASNRNLQCLLYLQK